MKEGATQNELKFKLQNNHDKQEQLRKALIQLDNEEEDLTVEVYQNYRLQAEADQVLNVVT